MRSGVIIAGLIAVLGSVETVRATETPELLYEDIVAGELRAGETRHVVGKYMGLVDLELQLYDLPLRFLLSEAKIGRTLLSFNPNSDNVIVEGTVLANQGHEVDGLPVFEIRAIHAGPTDHEHFSAWAARVSASRERSSAPLLTLGERIHQFIVEFQAPELFPLLEKVVSSAVERTRKEAAAYDTRGALQVLDMVFKRIPVKNLQGQFLAGLTTEFPDQSIIDDRVIKLGFRKREGRWLSEDEFKALEGFVRSDQEWVKSTEYEFELVIEALARENLTNLILRSRTTREYKELAKEGEIARGMSRAETARAAGFPERVRRRQIKKNEIDQWDYVDFRIYLINGQTLTEWTPHAGKSGPAAFEGIQEHFRESLADEGKRPVR